MAPPASATSHETLEELDASPAYLHQLVSPDSPTRDLCAGLHIVLSGVLDRLEECPSCPPTVRRVVSYAIGVVAGAYDEALLDEVSSQ